MQNLFLTCFFLFFSFFTKRLIAQINQHPNILFIIVDDGRYVDYASTGGPSWFVTPTINRIADEGANFKKDFVVLPLCEPSRRSIFTGRYPHDNGFTNNTLPSDTSTLTIARILRDNGYYTGLVRSSLITMKHFLRLISITTSLTAVKEITAPKLLILMEPIRCLMKMCK